MPHSFASVLKDMAASSVHAPAPLGGGRGGARSFRAAMLAAQPEGIRAQPAPDPALAAPQTTNFRVAKIDDGLGLVFGWAIVSKVDGAPYYDLNVDRAGPHAGERVPEHIPEEVMTRAALGLVECGAPGNEMHAGPDRGFYPFLFPLTTDIAKAMGVQSAKTGLMCAFKPPADMLAKFKSGELRGFSIEGRRLNYTEHAA